MLEINQIFDDKYRIVSILGRGGMSVVYKAENMALGNYWAIKQVFKTLKGRDIDYLAEPNILKTLNHPMLPRIIDIKEDTDSFYVIMDFIEGDNLESMIKKHKCFSEVRVLDWAKQICTVLDYLHGQRKPIIYRDMKPGNLMLTPEGNIKIIDFGIARQYKEESNTDTTIMGTRGYAAPEQYGKNQSDARTDIFSLGVTLYHLLTGNSPNEPPYEVQPLRSLDKRFSFGMEQIINKCTQNDPSMRYQSVKELLRSLENIYSMDETYKKLQRAKTGWFAVFVCVYLLCVGAGLYGWRLVDAGLYADYQQYFNNAVQMTEERNYTAADEQLTAAIAMRPLGLDGYIAKAQWFFAQQRYDECISYIDSNLYGRSFDLKGYSDKRLAAGMALKAKCYSMREKYSDAVFYYEECFKYDPSSFEYFMDYSTAAAKSGDKDKALSALDVAISLGADKESIALMEAIINITAGEAAKAAEQLDTICQTAVSQKLALQALEELLILVEPNGTQEMISTIEKYIKLPNFAGELATMERLAYLYSVLAQENNSNAYYNKAIGYYETMVSQGYERYHILDNMAVVYQNLNRLADAKTTMHRAIERYPQDYRPYIRMVSIMEQEISAKELFDRDYQPLAELYDTGMELYRQNMQATGKEDPDIAIATGIVDELKLKGWINE